MYANGREVLDLSGLTGEARMSVRLTSHRGRVAVIDETVSGDVVERTRDYRPCAPVPPPAPRRTDRPGPTLSGGGEG